MKLQKIYVYFFAILFIFNLFNFNCFASDLNLDEIKSELQKKYSGIASISLKFSMRENKNFSGNLTASKNKYFIEFLNRTLICNGKTIWNYTKNNKKVIINKFEESGEMSLQSFFFNFLNHSQPIGFKEETTSKGKKSYIIRFENSEEKDAKTLFPAKDLRIWVNKENFNLTTVKWNDDTGLKTLDIEELKINKKIPEKLFDFKPPKDTEIIDMR